MSNTPFSDTLGFIFDQRPDAQSRDSVLARLLRGNVKDSSWRADMRDLLSQCSSGPFDVSGGDPRVESESIVVVTNPQREVLAKCGPVHDARSCFDAMLFAAAVNAIRNLLQEPEPGEDRTP